MPALAGQSPNFRGMKIFDLIFVVAIGDLTHIPNHTHEGHLDPLQFWQYVLAFIPLWWIWVSHTIYANRFDADNRKPLHKRPASKPRQERRTYKRLPMQILTAAHAATAQVTRARFPHWHRHCRNAYINRPNLL
ncbi:low temperature requirement protein A [Cupriavidus basilensis]